MQKRGRPKALIETQQVAVRLPKAMVKRLQPHVSKEIRNRLANSFCDEARDPRMLKIAGQIEELAKDVRKSLGAEWHADQYAHQVFIETLRLLFAGLPVPKGKQAKLKAEPADAAKMIYNRYMITMRELEKNRRSGMKVPLSHILEGGND
jgi:hypothetical protein